MNKTIMFLGMLAVGFANAQQKDPYEGKVGVNTDMPNATLNVKSKVDNGKNLELENMSGTKLVTVLDNGKVGIGTDKPSGRLHIEPDVDGNNGIIYMGYNQYSNPIWTNNNLGFFRARGTKENPLSAEINDEVGNIVFQTYDGAGYNRGAVIGAVLTGTQGKRYSAISLDFSLQNIDGRGTENIMRIHHNRNIGIGTGDTEPTHKLHIKGTNPIRLEGLQTIANSESILVADEEGVVKKLAKQNLGFVSDTEWVYDSDSKKINLKRSGQTTQNAKFKNRIYYTENGAYRDIGVDSYKAYDNKTGANKEIIPEREDGITGYNRQVLNSKEVGSIMNRNILIVDKNAIGKYVTNTVHQTTVEADDTTNHSSIYATNNKVDISGTGQVGGAIAMEATVNVDQGTIDEVKSSHSRLIMDRAKKVGIGIASNAQLRILNNTQLIEEGIGSRVNHLFEPSSSSTITNLHGYKVKSSIEGNHTITNYFAFSHDGYSPSSTVNLTNNYGLFLGNVSGATNNNYAIYTNEGKVHFGDKVEVQSSIKVASPKTEEKCTSANAGTMSYKEINGSGIFGFCTKKESGEYIWFYFKGGQPHGTSANGGTFGSGL